MNINWMFGVAVLGICAGITSVYVYSETLPRQQPLAISYNPYENAVYAVGIIESDQATGSDINIFPEVSGTVTRLFVKEGQSITQGEPMIALDNSIQKAIVATDQAQFLFQKAKVKNLADQLEKYEKAYSLNHESVSKNTLDNARNSVKIAKESADVAHKQWLTSQALLDKYIIRAPANGLILRISTATGNYISPEGSYDSYTRALVPPVQIMKTSPHLQVRCYLNEILIPKLPKKLPLVATLFVRGLSDKSITLHYAGMQPYAAPNLQLPSPTNKRVDVRALPIIFTFDKPDEMKIFPGQLVDVYIKT